MKTVLFALAALIITGCATAPDKPVEINRLGTATSFRISDPAPGTISIDENCMALAKFTKAVALLRDAGAGRSDVNQLITLATAFPREPVIQEVYARPDISPQVGESNSYAVCKKVTYEVMLVALLQADTKIVEVPKATISKSQQKLVNPPPKKLHN